MDSNVFSRFVDLALIIILIFMIPLYYTSAINDSSVNTYVIHEVNEFGDQVCKNGYISVDMYEDLLNKLSNTDLLYNVKMSHTHDVYYPSGNGAFTTEETVTYEEDIKKQLYAAVFQSLTYYDYGDYVYGSDQMLYRYVGKSQIYPYDPALIDDFDAMTGASQLYPYWNLVGNGIPGKYLMRYGDRFSISIINRSDTISQKITSVLQFGQSAGIRAYGGGMITDENY